MKLTEEQCRALEDAAKPLVAWLNNNCHPHVKVIVETNGCELVEGVASRRILEFIKD